MAFANAGPAGLGIQGILSGTSGQPILSTVTFRLQILDASETCVLFEEYHTNQNLAESSGVFSLNLGSGTGQVNKVDSTTSLKANIFRNDVTPLTVTDCTNPVVMTSGQNRKVRITFDAGAGPVTLSPNVTIQSSAYASIAETLQGKTPSEIAILKDDATTDLTQANLESVFSATNFPALMGLIAGTSTSYERAGRLNGGTIPTVGIGESLRWNGTGWDTFVAGGGTIGVASVTAGAGLIGGTITSNGTLSVNTGTGIGQIVQLDGAAKIPASLLPSLTTAMITSGTLGVSNGGTGLGTVSPYSILIGNMTGTAYDATTCSTQGMYLEWQTGAGFVCVPFSASRVTTGTLGTVYGGLGLNASTAGTGQLLIGNGNGTGFTLANLTAGSGILITNGSGSISISSSGAGAAALTHFTESSNSAAPNATVPVSVLTSNNAASDVDFAIVPKGAGAITKVIPDGTAVGGNKRGNYALDLGAIRTAATQVASGMGSAIVGGATPTASGQYSFVGGGERGLASARESSTLGGSTNTASGMRSSAIGGALNIASGESSFASGYYLTAPSLMQFVVGSLNADKGGEDPTGWVATDPIFVVGNGASTGSRSNALMILKSGDIGIGTSAPSGKLHIAGGEIIAGPLSATAGDGGRLVLRELAAGGTNSVSLRAPDAIAGNYILTLPAATGASGQVLGTDASGVLSWVTSVGSAGWVQGGNSFSQSGTLGTNDTQDLVLETNNSPRVTITSGGSVGIGTSSPAFPLDVTGVIRSTSSVNAFSFNALSAGSFAPIVSYVSTGAADAKYWDFFQNGNSFSLRAVNDAYSASNNAIIFNRSGATITSVAIPAGSIGVGTTNPLSKLHILTSGANSDIFADTFGVGNATRFTGRFARGNSSSPTQATPDDHLAVFGGTAYHSGGAFPTTSNAAITMKASQSQTGGNQGAYMTFETTSTNDQASNRAERMRITADGNVGIGTTNPTSRLQVAGNVAASGGQIYSVVQTSAVATPLTFDTDLGNTMIWSNTTAAVTVNVHNMKAGGTYTLVVAGNSGSTGTVTINCFSGAGAGALPSSFVPLNSGRIAGTLNKSIYTLFSDGTNCLATWITGF